MTPLTLDAALDALALIRDPYRRSISPAVARAAYECPLFAAVVPASSVTTNALRARFARLALATYRAARGGQEG